MSLEVQLYKEGDDLPYYNFDLQPGKFQDVLDRRGDQFRSYIFYCLPDDNGALVYTIPWDISSTPNNPKPLWREEFKAPKAVDAGGYFARQRHDSGNRPGRLVARHLIEAALPQETVPVPDENNN